MKPSVLEDVASILAIAYGTAISAGLSAALIFREPAVRVESEVRTRTAVTIPDGYRAVSVPVHDVDAGSLRPGARVDVMVLLDTGDPNRIRGRAVLRNVPLLGQARTTSRDRDGQRVERASVTMLLTPLQAERLAVDAGAGRLHVSLSDEALLRDRARSAARRVIPSGR